MKKKLIFLISALLLLTATICLSACSQWEAPYPSLDEDGYTVSIRFDAGDGKMKGKNDVSVVEVFSLSGADTSPDGQKVIKILDPEDSRRGDGVIRVEHANHFLIGWYTERHEVTNEKGEKVYEYSGKWDFSTDTLKLDPKRIPPPRRC